MTQPKEQTPEQRFGAMVRNAREVRGWTQERLREQVEQHWGLSLSSTAMARLEQGKRPIRLNEAEPLARLLGLDLGPFGGAMPQLTEDEYLEAKSALQKIIEREAETLEQFTAQREKFDREYEELALERRALIDQRWRYHVMIKEFEMRHGDR